MLAGSFQLYDKISSTDKDVSKCRCINFAVRRDSVQNPNVRWTRLSNNEAARRFANLLVKEVRVERALCSFLAFSSGGQRRYRRGAALDPNPTIWVRGDLSARSTPAPLSDGLASLLSNWESVHRRTIDAAKWAFARSARRTPICQFLKRHGEVCARQRKRAHGTTLARAK